MKRYKYPRTPHLPWSPGGSSDDVIAKGVSQFARQEVVVTEKMDGENTTLYPDGLHARSLDSRYHPSRDWVKRFHAEIVHDIPNGWRICGENLYAQHSVRYENLPSYFLAISIWDEKNRCLSWQDSVGWFKELKLETPPILFDGVWDEAAIRSISVDEKTSEGYVVRLAREFTFDDFSNAVAKWVRPSHVTSETHWMTSELVPNGLKKANSKF